VLGMQVMTQSAMLGGAIGTGIVLLVVHMLLTSAFLLGLSLTYLRLINNMQFGDAEAEFDKAMAGFLPALLGVFSGGKSEKPKPAPATTVVAGKRDFDETMMGLGLGEVRERNEYKPPPPPPPAPKALQCPQCQVNVTVDDRFCGECGCKLK